MSGAGVVHYHSLHRPRSVPTALSPAPLVTIRYMHNCTNSFTFSTCALPVRYVSSGYWRMMWNPINVDVPFKAFDTTCGKSSVIVFVVDHIACTLWYFPLRMISCNSTVTCKITLYVPNCCYLAKQSFCQSDSCPSLVLHIGHIVALIVIEISCCHSHHSHEGWCVVILMRPSVHSSGAVWELCAHVAVL